jgi:predicted dehydrogenase
MTAVLVGCGGISRAWLEASAKIGGVKILGLVDIRPEAAEARAREFQLKNVKTGSDLPAMLNQVKPQAVFDCSNPSSHAMITLNSLEKGCHVLGEKPMAESMEDAQKMVEAARRAGKIYAVTQTRRYDGFIRHVKNFLESGAIGTVHTLHCDFFIGAHFGGFRGQMRHVLLLDMAIHTFDAARLLSGADPVSVQATDWNPTGSWYAHGASAIATFRMRKQTGKEPGTRNQELVYGYRGSWCSEGLNTKGECDWRIIGTKGTLMWDGGQGLRAERVAEPGGFISKLKTLEVPQPGPSPEFQGHAGVMREFRDCVLRGGTPETSCEDNIKSLAMVLSAIQSAETGQRVEIPV